MVDGISKWKLAVGLLSLRTHTDTDDVSGNSKCRLNPVLVIT